VRPRPRLAVGSPDGDVVGDRPAAVTPVATESDRSARPGGTAVSVTTLTGVVLRVARRPFVKWGLALGLLAVAVASVAHGATTGGDFRLAIWYPGQAIFHGRDPYDIASFERYYGVHQVEAFSKGWFPLYGPTHLWVAVVFAVMPVKVASALWFVISLGGLVAIAAVVARALDRRLGGPAVLAITAFLVLSRPGRATLETGQATVLYVLLTYVAWSQIRRRPWLAAVALAFALGKPPFGLPLLALVLARRLWPVAGRAVAVFVAASVPIVVWLGLNAGSLSSVWHALAHNLSYTDHNRLDAPGSPGRIDALSLVARYGHGQFGGGIEVAAFVVVVGLVAALVARASVGPGWPLSPAVVVLLGLGTVLCVAHEYYDLLVLAWPFAAAVRWPLVRLLDRAEHLGHGDPGGAVDRGAPVGGGGIVCEGGRVDEGGRWGAVLALSVVPALIVSVAPANDTLKLLGLASGTAIISTVTTVCLLLGVVGAMVAIGFDHPQEVDPVGAPVAAAP
jgi:Glycosyltransferase family 87